MSLSGLMQFFCVKCRISFFEASNCWVAISHRRDSGKILQRHSGWLSVFWGVGLHCLPCARQPKKGNSTVGAEMHPAFSAKCEKQTQEGSWYEQHPTNCVRELVYGFRNSGLFLKNTFLALGRDPRPRKQVLYLSCTPASPTFELYSTESHSRKAATLAVFCHKA